MPGPLDFRPATQADVDAVVALVESAYRGEASREGWTTEADLLDGQRTDTAAVAEAVARPDGTVLLATSGTTIVGCCQLVGGPGAAARFAMFAVAPRLQGRAIGDALLAEAERRARAAWGVGVLRMEVLAPRSDLLAWYGRRGYLPTGVTAPFPYGDPRYGLPRRDDLEFVVLEKDLGA
ncbi:MAG: GNAT family N-acetyltransferase [Acidimicrobiales bacterium]